MKASYTPDIVNEPSSPMQVVFLKRDSITKLMYKRFTLESRNKKRPRYEKTALLLCQKLKVFFTV